MISPSDHIKVLGLPTRVKNALLMNNVWKVGSLLNKTRMDFLRMVNIGPKTIADIHACLERHNLKAIDGNP